MAGRSKQRLKKINIGCIMADSFTSMDTSDGPGDAPYSDLSTLSQDQFFRLLAKKYGSHWEPLGSFLGIEDDNITTIKNQYPSADEQIFQMLTLWNKNCVGDSDSVKQLLITALEMADRKDLAVQVSQGKLYVERATPTTSSGKPLGSSIADKPLRRLAGHLSGIIGMLAVELGVSTERVSKIKAEHHGQVVEQSFKTLTFWRNNNPNIDQQNVLIAALKAIDRGDLAMRFENGTL